MDVAPAELMRVLVAASPGVASVPDVFDDDLDVPEVEAIIVDAAAGLRRRWPAIAYVYLNPVAAARARSSRPG